MSSFDPLDDWYRTHLGEPPEPDHVTGYWIFVLGALLALLGLAVFLFGSSFEAGSSPFWNLRQLGFTLALVAGAIVTLSIVYLLPLRDRAITLAGVGVAICLLAVIAFNLSYPSNWNVDTVDRSGVIMALYGLGIGVQLLTAFLYPMTTEGSAQPAPATGESGGGSGAGDAADRASKATFQFYEDRSGEDRWRLVHDNGNLIADSGEGYSSRRKARQGADSVRTNAPGADEEELESPPDRTATAAASGAGDAGGDGDDAAAATGDGDDAVGVPDDLTDEVDLSQARVEVYEDRGGQWRWRLRHRNGNVVADCGEGYASRSNLDDAVERIQSVAGDADTLEYDPAGYELYTDASDEWRWRLRHRNGRVLADSGEGYASRSNARGGIESVRTHAADEENFEVYEDAGGEWRWRLTASNGEIVADSGQGYSRTGSVQDAVDRFREYAPEADTLDYDPAAYELFQDRADEWRWRLRHRNGNVLADSGEGYSSRQKARQGMRSVIRNAPAAEVTELED